MTDILSKIDYSNIIKLIETDDIILNAGDNVAFGWANFDNDPGSGLVLSKCKKFKEYLPSDWNENNTIIIWGNLRNNQSWQEMSYVYSIIQGKNIVGRATTNGNYYRFTALIMKIN